MDFSTLPVIVRWLLGVSALLGLLWLMRWRIIYSQIWVLRPTGEPQPPKTQLDYDHSDAWFAHPAKAKDAASGDIPGHPDRQAQAQAAVFFIHPTSYFSRKHWNKAVNLETTDGFLEGLVLPNQAPAFTGEFKIYIPKYPQVTFATFATSTDRAERALEFATDEVERAFNQFLSEIGDLPFVVAGHSQGSYHAVALLARRLAGSPLMKRLIAVYAPGYLFLEDDFETMGVPLATDRVSSGAVQTWNAVSRRHWLPSLLSNLPQPLGGRPNSRPGPVRFACTNPLDPSRNVVPAAENRGAYLGGYMAASTPMVPQLSGARCEDGRLFIDDIADKRFKRALMSAGWYHAYEYGLFFENIRQDAERRLAHWRAAHK